MNLISNIEIADDHNNSFAINEVRYTWMNKGVALVYMHLGKSPH